MIALRSEKNGGLFYGPLFHNIMYSYGGLTHDPTDGEVESAKGGGWVILFFFFSSFSLFLKFLATAAAAAAAAL